MLGELLIGEGGAGWGWVGVWVAEGWLGLVGAGVVALDHGV